jgi:hypothetical protein
VERELDCHGPPGQSCSECQRNKAKCPFAAPVGQGAPKTNAAEDEAGPSKRTRHGRTKKTPVVVEDMGEDDAPPQKRKRAVKGRLKGSDSGAEGIDIEQVIKTVSLLCEQVSRMQDGAVQLAISVSRMANILGEYYG